MVEKDELQMIREARAAYAREWRAKNPDKEKANRERYWLNRAKRRQAEQEKADKEGC